MREIDLTALIEPCKGAAGIRLGEPAENLPRPLATTRLTDVERLDFGSVSVWIKAGAVCQIGVREGYRGTLAGVVRIGSTIAEVEQYLGSVTEDTEGNLVAAGTPGWCFETEEWRSGPTVEANAGARITEIFVYEPGAGEQGDGEDERRPG
ncbi:MAG: hypothetical protein ACREKR_02185 [Candidatus Methylomirabilales bacterium]